MPITVRSMEEALAAPRAKLGRAKEHVVELRRELEAYFSREPYAASHDYDPETRCHIFRAVVREPPPTRFALIVGDAVHNSRAALDHLVS